MPGKADLGRCPGDDSIVCYVEKQSQLVYLIDLIPGIRYSHSHTDVAKVTLTRSTATGKSVMANASGTLKRLTLELGGNDAALVLDDVELKEVAPKLFVGATVNSGQACLAIKRLCVHDTIYGDTCEELGRLARKTVVDDGLAQGAELGPLQNKAQFERVKEFIADAKLNGTIVAGGEALPRSGYFIVPTIVRDIPDDARLVKEEQFGPILPVLRYSEVSDAVARADDTPYGLCATVWSSDPKRALDAARLLQAGTVWINNHLDIMLDVPFLGAKQSGHGVELGQLCQSISRSRLDCRGIELQFIGRPLLMNSERCWRLTMIISKLITNAARHAFEHGGGKIQVDHFQCGPFVKCRVADDGRAPEKIRPGRGSAIVEGLIASLNGTINQHFGPGGAVSDMTFPGSARAQHTGPSALFPPKGRDTVLRVGPLELDLIERTARRWDRAIDLLPREFRLLEYMMRRKGQVLTRAALLEEVWNYKFVPQSNLVDVHIGRLRRKVDEPHELPMIHNVRGVGFILRAPA